MDWLPTFERYLWILQILAMVALLFRLCVYGLATKFRWLTFFLLAVAGVGVSLMSLPFNTNRYAYTWAALQVLKWFLSAMAVRELAGLILAEYQGLSILSRRTLAAVFALCALGSLTIVSFGFYDPAESFPLLRLVLLFQQAMALTLTLCLFVLLGFVLWFPLPLDRNLHLYSFCFLIPLFATATAVGVRVFGGAEWHRAMSTATLLAYAVCFSWWAVRLRPAGESGPRFAVIPRAPDDERRLLNKLAALNQALESRRRDL